jgi:hypothetical protein
MSARKIQDQKTTAREMFVQHAHANGKVSATPPSGDMICSTDSRWGTHSNRQQKMGSTNLQTQHRLPSPELLLRISSEPCSSWTL